MYEGDRYFVTRVKKDAAVPRRYRRAGWLVFDRLHHQHGQVWPTKPEAEAEAALLNTRALLAELADGDTSAYL
jgi:hypothetical protein